MKPSEKAIDCAWNHQGHYSKEKIEVLLVHAYAIDVDPLLEQSDQLTGLIKVYESRVPVLHERISELEQKDKENFALHMDLIERDKEIERLQQQCDMLHRANDEMAVGLNEKDKEIERLKKFEYDATIILVNRERTIAELEQENARLKSEIGGLENTINIVSTPRIAELEQENAKLKEQSLPKSFIDNFGKETI